MAAAVYEPHPYKKPRTGTCGCAKADHLPCATCGASANAYVHSDEAAEGSYVLVVRGGDNGTGAEKAD